MPYTRVEHTADIEILVTADTLENLFRDAFDAMIEIMNPQGIKSSPKSKKIITIRSIDLTGLIIDFLSEVLAEAEINDVKYSMARIKELTETKIEVELEGVPVETFAEDIKAVTYHEADVKKNDKSEWETKIIFDV